MRLPWTLHRRFVRNQFVLLGDGVSALYLGRLNAGPFFHADATAAPGEGRASGLIEILGELIEGRLVAANTRPAPGSPVITLPAERVGELLGLHGGMLVGKLAARGSELALRLDAANKGVLPRNVGVFGTVGAGKTNTAQVLIEEAAANDWAVVVLDVEGEYTEMDSPCGDEFVAALESFGRVPEGLHDFHVLTPASCASERKETMTYTLRLADFDADVIGELLEVSPGERHALLDVLEFFHQRAKAKVETSETADYQALLDPSPKAKVAFQLASLLVRVRERGPQSTEQLDYLGLASKLGRLQHSGIIDQNGLSALDPQALIQPGRVSVVDVSQANDQVRNLVTADLLRKLFVHKIVHAEAAPTLLVLEEAHSFVSKERLKVMQATLKMLRDVARRGRKRWLSLAFVSQQPGHLPTEIFELCNTRLVHTVRSLQNLEALMATAGDVDQSQWARCPLLGPGEALVSSPQLPRPMVATIRPAATRRRFTR